MGFNIVYKINKVVLDMATLSKEIISFPKNLIKIERLINMPTYYPEFERKSYKERWKDNFKWLCKYRELNTFYNSYGLDVKDFRRMEDFIPHNEFCRLRNKGNQKLKMTFTGNYNYINLLRDKYVFSKYLTSAIGNEFVVGVKALICNKKLFLCDENKWTDIDEILIENSEFVYKVLDGECADGVMLVKFCDNKLFVDDEPVDKNYFLNNICCQNIIVQDIVTQHEKLRAFKTKCVNTLRIVTIKGKSGEINLFNAFLRLSESKDSFVDNRAKGGLGIGIELDTGKLMEYGLPHGDFGVKSSKHNLSGILFKNYQLPFWNETVELVKNAHKQFYDIQSIGWDVILTDQGPCLLEANDDWEIGGPQDTYGGLKQKWNELVDK